MSLYKLVNLIFWSIKIAINKGKMTKKGTHKIKNQKVFKIDFIKTFEDKIEE